ncbi:MAG: chemotaxis-specific protein-glutamate methyltransferase CheB [Leptolyngbya sp. SIO3F4]|nr:chemotaxis-specific protein-glutamate methyltransferase CheB [Leptolyngbya sp. SIO3F4]
MKVAIANDSAIAIEALRRAILTTRNYELLWIAQTGADAVSCCAKQCPDLLLMDMHMPNLNGVEATHQIMQQSPCVILIVTASITSHSAMVFEAMGYGARDVVKTPRLGTENPQAVNILLKKMATLVKYPTVSQNTIQKNSNFSSLQKSGIKDSYPKLVVIGASTGGPGALQKILSQLPNKFNAAIVIVQHIDEQFAPGLVHWLNQSSKLPVIQARNGDRPVVGKVLLAGGNQHLLMRPNGSLRYTHEPADYAHRPSVDVFFHSVADYWKQPGTAILLTGMGKDGALGLGHLCSVKWHTIAESETSCIVFGMPKAAIEQGAAQKILTLDQITSYLLGKIV